jgi:hypothetical protein
MAEDALLSAAINAVQEWDGFVLDLDGTDAAGAMTERQRVRYGIQKEMMDRLRRAIKVGPVETTGSSILWEEMARTFLKSMRCMQDELNHLQAGKYVAQEASLQALEAALASVPNAVGTANNRDTLVDEIRSQIARVVADSRYQDRPATVQVNAPLALIQVEMKAQVAALRWVLERITNGATPAAGAASKHNERSAGKAGGAA